MLTFVTRRLFATLLVLLVASFIVYMLTAYSGDPLQELRQSRDPDAPARIAYLTAQLDLDTPPVLRYFKWLAGVAGCFIGQCDLGISVARGEAEVTAVLSTAIGSTLQLVTLATILAIVLGVSIGMTTALRQYSGYDYTVTFMTFVFYSLPIFWVAVLLKEFGAIRFNEFLGNPEIPIWMIIVIGIVLGLVFSSIVGGDLANRVRTFVILSVGGAGLLALLLFTGWFESPSIGILGVAIFSIANALIVALLTTGLKHTRIKIAFAIAAIAPIALWFPFQFLFFYGNAAWTVVLAVIVLAGIGLLAGWLFGGDNRWSLGRATALAAGLGVIPLVFDQMFQRWDKYESLIPLANGVISTIGASTPSIDAVGDYWMSLLDTAAHIILPTIALMVISLAAYTRYARSSLLEVLGQDYVRTARAKGLSERVVILRHAFRNAMIPIATIIAFDFGALIGGAIITENVFAWKGMGAVFSDGLEASDVNLVMGFFLVTGLLAVVFNLVADLLYSSLDPRIRVN